MHSPREYFHSYLQSLDVERSGLPELFSTKLKSVLAHYGVTDLERTPELEGAVFRIFLAQQRSAPDLAIVTAILQRWHTEPRPTTTAEVRCASCSTGWCSPPSCASPRSVISPAACGSAGSTSRSSTASGPTRWPVCPAEVEYLPRNPDAADRAARMDALAAIPERIVSSSASGCRTACPSASRCSRC